MNESVGWLDGSIGQAPKGRTGNEPMGSSVTAPRRHSPRSLASLPICQIVKFVVPTSTLFQGPNLS